MPRIDLSRCPARTGSSYPPPYDAPCKARHTTRLGDGGGLTQFGVNLITLPPGAWSSQRHWHETEDELVYVLSGELVLVEDQGETNLGPGEAAAWKAGVQDGHHLVNRSDAEATFIVVGSRNAEDRGEYSDIDMKFDKRATSWLHKDGTPY